ncbi:MAG: YciI family protein [Actinobacteria bacterium]|nr:YciI family protein [Actinomycetota bacterium]
MFLLLGRYLKPADEVEAHLDAHRTWVRDHVEAGVFIAAGREIPLQGGLIVATGVTRDEVDAIIAKDPYLIQKVAEYDVREYDVVLATPGTEALQG